MAGSESVDALEREPVHPDIVKRRVVHRDVERDLRVLPWAAIGLSASGIAILGRVGLLSLVPVPDRWEMDDFRYWSFVGGVRSGWIGRTSIMRAIKRKKGIRWMPWRREAMKDVVRCDKPWGAANKL